MVVSLKKLTPVDGRTVIYALIVILLYLPLVFMGANVFFPKYSHYYQPTETCYKPYPADADRNKEAAVEYEKIQQECSFREQAAQRAFEEEKRSYDSQKYVFITAVNFIALLASIFITMDASVVFGLFIGSTIATFFSTWIYFDTRSKIGFGILVLIFIATVYFINKARTSLVGKK